MGLHWCLPFPRYTSPRPWSLQLLGDGMTHPAGVPGPFLSFPPTPIRGFCASAQAHVFCLLLHLLCPLEQPLGLTKVPEESGRAGKQACTSHRASDLSDLRDLASEQKLFGAAEFSCSQRTVKPILLKNCFPVVILLAQDSQAWRKATSKAPPQRGEACGFSQVIVALKNYVIIWWRGTMNPLFGDTEKQGGLSGSEWCSWTPGRSLGPLLPS